MEELNQIVEKGKTLDRLLNNPDFKEIILTDYLEQSALVLSGQLANVSPDMKGKLVEQLTARSIFSNYMNMIIGDANNAKQEINFQNSEEGQIDE